MRTGIIISYNKLIGIGFIKDVNKQKIRFYIEHGRDGFSIRDIVHYKVVMMETGLMAVEVSLAVRKNIN